MCVLSFKSACLCTRRRRLHLWGVFDPGAATHGRTRGIPRGQKRASRHQPPPPRDSGLTRGHWAGQPSLSVGVPPRGADSRVGRGEAGRKGGAGPASAGSSGTALGAGLAAAWLWGAGAAVEAPAAWGLALGGSACCCGQRAARVRCWGESSPRATSCWQLRAVRCAQSAAADVKAVVVRTDGRTG